MVETRESMDKRLWVPFGVAASVLFVCISGVAWFNGQFIAGDIKATTEARVREVQHAVELRFKDVDAALRELGRQLQHVDGRASVARHSAQTWIELFRARNPSLSVPDLPE